MEVSTLSATLKPKLDAAVAHLVDELKSLRTGRANAQVLDAVSVDAYGSRMPLKQVATVTVPEATQLLIQPFDATLLGAIRTAIQEKDLGFSMSDDGRQLRLVVPALTTERREELVKQVGKLAETTRISVRSIRGDAWEQVQQAQKASEITEDQRDWARDTLDKLAAEYNDKIAVVAKEKEQELRTI
jgi:ribosome recycling factor